MNRTLYQGQYAQENDTTGWNEFQLRMYDARFGRWLNADPYGQFWSPYVGMGNAPNLGVDPDGGWSWVTAAIGFAVGGAAGYIASDGDWGWALAGAIGGGLIGGASFDQSFKGWDGGTSEATRALVLKPTSFGIETGQLLASVGREYIAFQANPRAQLAYNAFTQALVTMGQAAGEKEYVVENVKKGNYKFRSQYKFNRLTGAVSDYCWKLDPSTNITAAIGSADLFVHNLRDPETKVGFNINYYGPQGGSGIVNGHVMYNNLVEGYTSGNALFRGAQL